MVMDDGLDLRLKIRKALCCKIIASQALRRLQVVEGSVCPDTEVMKGGGNEQEIGVLAMLRREKEQIVQDTIDVIPVGAQVPAKGASERT